MRLGKNEGLTGAGNHLLRHHEEDAPHKSPSIQLMAVQPCLRRHTRVYPSYSISPRTRWRMWGETCASHRRQGCSNGSWPSSPRDRAPTEWPAGPRRPRVQHLQVDRLSLQGQVDRSCVQAKPLTTNHLGPAPTANKLAADRAKLHDAFEEPNRRSPVGKVANWMPRPISPIACTKPRNFSSGASHEPSSPAGPTTNVRVRVPPHGTPPPRPGRVPTSSWPPRPSRPRPYAVDSAARTAPTTNG